MNFFFWWGLGGGGGNQAPVIKVICKKGSHLQRMFNVKKFASKKFKKERGVVLFYLTSFS